MDEKKVTNYLKRIMRKTIHEIVKVMNIIFGYKIWARGKIPEIYDGGCDG